MGRRLAQTPYNFNPAQVAHARKCMRQETATEPSTGSTLEFPRIEWQGPAHLPTAPEPSDRSCLTRSSSPHSCAQHGLHPCGRVDAIAANHSARVPRQMPRKRKSRQTCVRDLLNARTCSSRSDLVAALPLAQEIFASSTPHAAVCGPNVGKIPCYFFLAAVVVVSTICHEPI